MAGITARPWWLWLASASFIGYFVFLHLSFFYEREPMGVRSMVQLDGAHIRSITPGSAAERLGFAAGDRIVSMNGIAISDGNDFSIGTANMPVGEAGEWLVERNGAQLSITTPPLSRRPIVPNLGYLVAFAGFALSLALGLVVLWRGPPVALTWLGGWLLCSLGCVALPLFTSSFATLWRALPVPVQALILPAALSTTAAHLLMLVFCATATRARVTRGQLIAASVPGVLITVYVDLYIVLTIYEPHAAVRMPIPDWLNLAGPLSYPVYIFATAWMVAAAARRAPDITDRRRARTLLVGLVLGGAGCLIVALSLGLTRTGGTVPADSVLFVAIPIFAMMPVAIAYATLRHRLFDIRVIIRQGLQYALARGILTQIIPVTVLVMTVLVMRQHDRPLDQILMDNIWVYGAILVMIAVIHRNRERWMSALDRRFFRERYAAEQILKDVVDTIGRSNSFEEAAQKVVSRIDSALHPVMTAVMLRPRTATSFTAAARLPETSRLSSLLSGNAITQVVRALGRPVVFGTQGLRDIPPDQQAWLAESNVEVVVPIATDSSKDEAVLVLGPRRSEEPYSREDLDLLATIGASLGFLIGRSPSAEAPTMASSSPAPTLANRYRIERPIGEGGMGIVYAAIDETLERRVAIKVIKDQHLAGDGLARFQREARTAASLSHPNIVTVHDFGVDDAGSPYLVMELLEGQSLREAIKKNGRMPLARALPVLAGLSSAIDEAHARGVIHRDLKPENVFLIGNGTHAKVLDYGIAKALQSTTTFATPGVMGTLAYMAPEQASGENAVPAWDVWALTVIAFEMLTGQHPFGGGLPVNPAIRLKTVLPDASDELAAAIDSALSLSPAERPATAGALVRSMTR